MAAERRQLDLRTASAALVAGAEHAPTMAAIARAVGIAKPTLYRLAGSREDLLRLCLDAEAERLIGHLHEALRTAPREDAADLVDAAVERFAVDSAAGLDLLFGGRFPQARPAARRVEDRLAQLLRRGGPHGDPDPVAAARLLGAATASALRRREDDQPHPR